jgi:hypothetical protein
MWVSDTTYDPDFHTQNQLGHISWVLELLTPESQLIRLITAGLFLIRRLHISHLHRGMLLSETLSPGIFAYGSDRTARN